MWRVHMAERPCLHCGAKRGNTMSTEENKAIVPRFFDAFAANDQATLNEV